MLHSSFQNLALGVKNIAAFLGIPLTEEELQFVVERSSFQSMKKNSENTHGPVFGNVLFRKGRKLQVAHGQKCHSRTWAILLFFIFVLILALQVNIKQVITLLEKTIQGALVRKVPSKVLTAEPLLEAHR